MEMTITRALTELKTMDARIRKAINNVRPVAIYAGKKPVAGYKDNDEFVTLAKANKQSVDALIKRRNEIKAAVVASNAVVEVTIGGKTMTRADAIERKTNIVYEQMYVNKLKSDHNAVLAEFNRETEKVKDKVDKLVETAHGKDKKVAPEDYQNVARPYLEQNEIHLLDPLDIKKLIADLEEEIDNFVTEVDFVLSESNSTTTITVSDN